MSDNTSSESQMNGGLSIRSADLAFDSVAAWVPVETENVVKKQVSLATPSESQVGKDLAQQYANEAGREYLPSHSETWQIRRGQSGSIAHLKEGNNATVRVRKDDLGDDTHGNKVTGYSFSHNVNNEVVREEMVIRDLPGGLFTGMVDSKIYRPGEPVLRARVREVMGGSTDDSVFRTNIDQLANKSDQEYQFLSGKLTQLENKLGPIGESRVGEVVVDSKLDQQPATQAGTGAFEANTVPQAVQGMTQVAPALNEVRQYQQNMQTQPGGSFPQLAGGSNYHYRKPVQLVIPSRSDACAQGNTAAPAPLRTTEDGRLYQHGVLPATPSSTYDGRLYKHVDLPNQASNTHNDRDYIHRNIEPRQNTVQHAPDQQVQPSQAKNEAQPYQGYRNNYKFLTIPDTRPQITNSSEAKPQSSAERTLQQINEMKRDRDRMMRRNIQAHTPSAASDQATNTKTELYGIVLPADGKK